MKKIVVTGMGAVTPVGIGVENYWNNITAGASGIDTIKTFDPSELAVQIAGRAESRLNPKERVLLWVLQWQVLQQSHILRRHSQAHHTKR